MSCLAPLVGEIRQRPLGARAPDHFLVVILDHLRCYFSAVPDYERLESWKVVDEVNDEVFPESLYDIKYVCRNPQKPLRVLFSLVQKVCSNRSYYIYHFPHDIKIEEREKLIWDLCRDERLDTFSFHCSIPQFKRIRVISSKYLLNGRDLIITKYHY